MLCERCEERKIFIKKWRLCKKCYTRLYHSGEIQKQDARIERGEQIEPEYNRPAKIKELNFLRNFFDHNNWLYEPVTFRLRAGSYTPDFYDQRRDIFIEVVGSRQAYHQNKEKYEEMAKLFPHLSFEIRTPDGNFLSEKEPNWKEAGAWPEYGTTAK